MATLYRLSDRRDEAPSGSALGPRGIGNPWSSPDASGHGGMQESQVMKALEPRTSGGETGGDGFEPLIQPAQRRDLTKYWYQVVSQSSTNGW